MTVLQLHTFVVGIVLNAVEILIGLIAYLTNHGLELAHHVYSLRMVNHLMLKTLLVVVEDVRGRIDLNFSIRIPRHATFQVLTQCNGGD